VTGASIDLLIISNRSILPWCWAVGPSYCCLWLNGTPYYSHGLLFTGSFMRCFRCIVMLAARPWSICECARSPWCHIFSRINSTTCISTITRHDTVLWHWQLQHWAAESIHKFWFTTCVLLITHKQNKMKNSEPPCSECMW